MVLRAAVQFSHICVSYRTVDVHDVMAVAELFWKWFQQTFLRQDIG